MLGLKWTALAAGTILGLAATGSPAAEPRVPPPAEVLKAIGHLGPVPQPPGNPLTRAKVDLGRKLFEDNGLAGDGSLSCQTCHLPDHGFAVPQALGPAYPSQIERRNSPSLVNVAFATSFIWDGRAGDLDKQTLGPLQNILHLNNNLDLLVERLKTDADYRKAFAAAFGDDAITPERIAQALGSFERSLVFDDAPIDRYMDGDTKALDPAQKRGLALFMGKANCVACHSGPALSDNRFHALGVPDAVVTGNSAAMASLRFDAKRQDLKDWAGLAHDPGRELATRDPADRGKFRTMGLRNIAQSAPYMHNGALATLDDVVRFYAAGGGETPNKAPELKPVALSDGEVADLVAFMHALTGRQRALPQ